MSTALAAYLALYAFEQQSKSYGDAARAVQAASRTPSEGNVADLVERVEGTLRRSRLSGGS